jgi:murein DD-endopeptidase MepM/ murein hydrolase activator NlpD
VALVLSALLATASPAAAKTTEQKIKDAQRAANATAAKLDNANSDLARAESAIAKFKAQSTQNAQQIARLQASLKAYAIREYETNGNSVRLTIMDDPSAVARGRYFVRTVALNGVDQLDNYQALVEDQAQTQAALDRSLKSRLAVVAQLRAQSKQISAQLGALGKAMKAQKSGQRVLAKGPWVCPVQGPRAFHNDWGNPRSGGRVHKGTDILSPSGTPVVAPVAGSVTTRTGGLGGNAVYLRGSDGNTYYGAHLSRFGSTGRVQQGQVIGYVGATGNARGGPPHLHFEIHPGGGAAVNPFGTLRTYC